METVKRWAIEFIPYLFIIIMVFLIRAFVVTPVRVNGASMQPTLYDGDYLILEKLNPRLNRFDIIVLNYKEEKLVKRIVGLPGEHVKYEDNQLYINGELVKENIPNLETFNFELQSLGVDEIPNNYYFVMGDNRENSTDSRYIGLIKEEDIVGKVRLQVFPFKDFGLID
jgi:signal peptidase I